MHEHDVLSRYPQHVGQVLFRQGWSLHHGHPSCPHRHPSFVLPLWGQGSGYIAQVTLYCYPLTIVTKQ